MNRPLRITVAFLGLYAGIVGIQHGIFEMLQGNTAPDGLMFSAIGPPCRPETVWHACFPALSLIPNLLVIGVAALVVGLALLVWTLFFVRRRRGGWVLGGLAILLLLGGGGFVPVFIGLVAAAASSGLHRPAANRGRGSIEHVPSTQRIYSTSLADLTDFITWRLSTPLPPGNAEAQAPEGQHG